MIFSCLLCNVDEMLSTMVCRIRKQRMLCECAQYLLLIKAAPVLRGVFYNPLWFCSRGTVGQWRKTFQLPWKFDCSFSNNTTQDLGHTADTATSVPQRNCGKCQIYGPMGDWWKDSSPPFSKPLSKTEPLESFWLRPSKAEGSCIPHFPWDLMKYTASGLLSIWSFRLLNQWKKDPSCHKRHMFGVTCCSGVLMPVVDIISTPYTLITIHSVQTLQSALRQTVF